MSKIRILKASEEDSQILMKLEKEYMKFHQALDRYFSFKEDISEIWLPYLKSILKDENFIVLLAKTEDNIIGYSIAKIASRSPVYKIEKSARILDLYVAPSHDRKRVSKLFIEEIINWAREKGVSYIEHPIATKDKAREQLSRELGFEDYVTTLKKKI